MLGQPQNQGLLGGGINKIETLLGKAFGLGSETKPAPAAPAPSAPTTPVSRDTPGRHKSLLGA